MDRDKAAAGKLLFDNGWKIGEILKVIEPDVYKALNFSEIPLSISATPFWRNHIHQGLSLAKDGDSSVKD